MIISNASPLMYLSKLNKLNLLRGLFKEIIIPKEVYNEVVTRGKEAGFLDAYKVEKAIEEGWLKIKEAKIEDELEEFAPEIDMGEIAVICLSKKLKPSLVLIDDASARTIAESQGFNVKGTVYVLIKAYKNNLITKKEAKNLINHLVIIGFRISHEFYIQLLEELEKA